jgi:hypothetical protein
MSNHDPNLDAPIRIPVHEKVIDMSMSTHGTPQQSTRNESPNKKIKLFLVVDGNHQLKETKVHGEGQMST